MKKALLLAGMACLFTSQAMAETSSFFFKPYLGLDYVHSWLEVEKDETLDTKLIKDKVNAGSFSIGAKFHQNFAIEGFYMQSAKSKKTTNLADYDASIKADAKYKVLGADLIASAPICYKLEFLGSIGAGYYKLSEKAKAYINNEKIFDASYNSHKWGLRLGAGIQYNFNEHIAARVMLHNTRIDSYDSVTDVTAGLRYYF